MSSGAANGLPSVCVVMPAYKAADTIAKSIQSILDQNYPGVIIGVAIPRRDTATLAAARAIASSSVVVVEQPDDNGAPARAPGAGNAGAIAAARNLVFDHVRADLYMFLDADDYMMPGTIEKYVRHRMESGKPGLRFGHYLERPAKGETHEFVRRSPFIGEVPNAFAKLAILNYIGTGSVMIDRIAIDRVGGMDCTINHGEDWHFWMRIAREFPVFGLDVVAYEYTYASLGRETPFRRKRFEEPMRALRDVSPPPPARILGLICIRAMYAKYYLRTFGRRRSFSEFVDIHIGDILSVPVALAIVILRKKGMI